MEVNSTPICAKCKHIAELKDIDGLSYINLCRNPSKSQVDIITGHKTYPTCRFERTSSTMNGDECGPKGNHFEPKVSLMKKIIRLFRRNRNA